MSPVVTSDPRTATRRLEQPDRPLAPTRSRPPVTVIRAFAAPVVRELPPRRQAAGGAW